MATTLIGFPRATQPPIGTGRAMFHVDGPLLQGIGSLLAGLTMASGAVIAVVKRHPIAAFFRDRTLIVAERDGAVREVLETRRIAASEQTRAEAAEGAAASWEAAARAINERINMIVAAQSVDRAKLRAMIGYTQRVVEYALFLEASLAKHAITIDRVMPEVPELLREDLRATEYRH